MQRPVEVEARITDYVRNAMTDEYDSGAFASYDATVLEITSPASAAPRELRIYHDRPASDDSTWRKLSGTVRFEIDPDLLSGDHVVFSGAVANMRLVE